MPSSHCTGGETESRPQCKGPVRAQTQAGSSAHGPRNHGHCNVQAPGTSPRHRGEGGTEPGVSVGGCAAVSILVCVVTRPYSENMVPIKEKASFRMTYYMCGLKNTVINMMHCLWTQIYSKRIKSRPGYRAISGSPRGGRRRPWGSSTGLYLWSFPPLFLRDPSLRQNGTARPHQAMGK